MVHHLEETIGIHYDSTANNNHGIPKNALTQDVDGKIDGADEFGIFYDFIDLPKNNMTSGESEITVEFWINPYEWDSDEIIWDEYRNSYWQFSIMSDSWYTRDNSTKWWGSRDNDLSMPEIPIGEWHHLAFVYSVSQNLKAIYLDGVIYNYTNISIDPLTTERTGANIGYGVEGDYFDGKIDEVRLSSHAYSQDWLKTEYNNQNNPDMFYDFGPQEYLEIIDYYSISLNNYWNVLSIPFNTSINKTSFFINYNRMTIDWNDAIDNEIILDYVYHWNRSSQTYEITDLLKGGFSYNFYSFYNCDLIIEKPKNINDSQYITGFSPGWNNMGIPFNSTINKDALWIEFNGTDYNWTEATTNNNPTGNPILNPFVYSWNSVNQEYYLTEFLEPGKGYLIYSYYKCKLKK
jgi:hypothetical protein